MAIRDLRGLTLIVSVMVVTNMLLTPLTVFAPPFFPELYPIVDSDMPTGPALVFDFTVLGITLLTWILFGRWIYLAGHNLVEAGYHDLEFTPAARIWWYAVPLACLVKPFQGMRELWNASHGNRDYSSETAPLVAIWWALWLLSGFVGYGLRIFASQSGLTWSWIEVALELALAIVAIMMIRRIAEAQTQLSDPRLADVFA
jgi:hypothetical protein